MLGFSVTAPLAGLRTRVQDWAVSSQLGARRNAMVASTACAQRRYEREEVAEYLAARSGRATPGSDAEAQAVTQPRAARG